ATPSNSASFPSRSVARTVCRGNWANSCAVSFSGWGTSPATLTSTEESAFDAGSSRAEAASAPRHAASRASAIRLRQRILMVLPTFSVDTLELTGLGTVVAGQLAQQATIGRRAHSVDQCLEPRVALERVGEAKVISLPADAEELKAGFLAGQAQAHPQIG